MMNKFAKLKAILQSSKLDYAMEAHNAVSAIIAEHTGFEVIWASGLTISASFGHRDCNEVSWTQIIDNLEFMSNATSIPILMDGDTGFGNFNNVRELVKKLCSRGIAGVCLEDKIFPKTNSFIDRNQSLASIEEFCGKLKAAKDTQTDPNFSVVARTEALIAGQGMQEALTRAHYYKDAGADAILVHSKKSTAEEIESFCSAWDYSIPVVIVPTKYCCTPTHLFEKLSVSLIIWANQNFRASMFYMQYICKKILDAQSCSSVEGKISSLDEIFKMVNNEELEIAEEKYFSCLQSNSSVN